MSDEDGIDVGKLLSGFYGEPKTVEQLLAENAALREQIAKLCALYDKHANPSRWIGVEERLPEAGERVLVWFDHYTSPAVATWFLGEGFFADYPDGTAEHDTVEICYVTHWMPLPEPPEASDE